MLKLDSRHVPMTDAQAGKLLFMARAVPVHNECSDELKVLRLAYGFTADDAIVSSVISEIDAATT